MNNISETTFSNVFSSMKMFEFRLKISLKFVPKGPINNGSDNGLASTRGQDIIWTKDG